MFCEIKNICFAYNKNEVLKNVNVSFEKGEILCALGKSGCGKTTLLNIVGGFLKPSSGEIYIDGNDIVDIEPKNRPTSTVFQNYALFSNMTVYENVAYGLKMKGIKGEELKNLVHIYIDIVHLNDIIYKNVEEISGGQKQRVALARALIVKPLVCLLDEPLSNLDANLRYSMRKEIKRIQKETNTSMIFVTHDIEEALAIADKIVILNDGRVEFFGDRQKLLSDKQNEFVKEFINLDTLIFNEDGSIYKRIL